MQSWHFILPVCMVFLFPSCDPGMVYDQYRHVENGNWKWEDTKVFDADISDTISEFNIYLMVRHTTDYPMRNLYTFVDIVGPEGQHLRDTINIILAKPDGEWLGKGLGKYREISLLYRKNTIFNQPGIYRFTLEQGMRRASLPVIDVGLRIERTHSSR